MAPLQALGKNSARPDHGMFEGITRRTVIEIAADLQLRSEVRRVHADEIHAADEIFTRQRAESRQ